MYKTDFWTLWEKVRVGCFERTACILSIAKQITSLSGMHDQVLGPGALGRPRGIGWQGRWEGWSGWGIHVTTWLIHVNVWQNPLKCCEVISLQLIKINEKKKKKENQHSKAFENWTDIWTTSASLSLSPELRMCEINWNQLRRAMRTEFRIEYQPLKVT